MRQAGRFDGPVDTGRNRPHVRPDQALEIPTLDFLVDIDARHMHAEDRAALFTQAHLAALDFFVHW